MKKLILIALLFAACQSNNHDGLYFNHGESEYSMADDTIEIKGDRIIDHVGFQRKRHGRLLPKEFSTEELYDLHPRFEKDYLILKNSKYIKIN